MWNVEAGIQRSLEEAASPQVTEDLVRLAARFDTRVPLLLGQGRSGYESLFRGEEEGAWVVTAAELRAKQQEVCKKYHLTWTAAPPDQKVGIAENVKTGVMPINGLRHSPRGDTSGWYIWAGEEPSSDPDFFKPLHIEHLAEWCPAVLQYLGLPPGSRFLIAPNHEGVWEDESLLRV